VVLRDNHGQFRHPIKPGRVMLADEPGRDLGVGTLGSILR
jgi:predicted RNA binding protein YcfA (HicA-like mRNA interferase family)